MRSVCNMLSRTLALFLALTVGLVSMASASVNHESHCVPATERAETAHVNFDIQNNAGNHNHVVGEVETTDVGGTDCQPHFCSDVLIGLVGCSMASHQAMPMVVPEPANLRALARILGLYRPPSL